MTNNQLIIKLKKDMQMRNFSKYTYDSYLGKTRDIMRYYGEKQLEEVTTEELREFLLKYLKEERKLSDRSINYYNSVIRFIYEVALDKLLNKKQLPMRKQKKTVYKVLTKEELSAFFNVCDNFKFKTIFMLVYGSGLRIGEVANLRVEDIDSKNMRKYRQNKRRGRIFLSESGKAITVGVIREHFRKYRRKAKINEKATLHTLRHNFATDLIERGATLIQVKELMGQSNIRSTMAYIHVANVKLDLESPLDAFLKGEE